jgi:hypothetical protein
VERANRFARWYERYPPTAGAVVLLLVIGALAALNWRVLRMTIDISPAETDRGAGSREDVAEAAAVAPFDPKPLSSFPETGARPLFSPARRPSAVAAQALSRSPPDVQLVGVVMIAPTQKRALIRSPHEPRGRWLSEGGQIGGWNVLTIGASEVIIDGRGERHELKLPRPGTTRRAKP